MTSAAEIEPVATIAPDPSPRLETLDLFRGLTVAAMLLVNNPGSWAHIFPPLEHAEWHGWTPTDLIFPFFLFIVGMTTALSLEAQRRRGASDRQLVAKIIKRGCIIVLLGIAVNAFPFLTTSKVEGMTSPGVLDRIADRFIHLRFSGVLQRIGVVYIAAALLTLRTSRRQQIAIIAGILLGYCIVMLLVPVPPGGVLGLDLLDQPDRTIAAYTDRLILGANHIWKSARTWDPEGPLSTIPAVATAMLGFLCGRTVMRRRDDDLLVTLFVYGSLGIVAGLIWNLFFPINKNLWTSSYVVFTAGIAASTLATMSWIFARLELTPLRRFLLPFGANPLLAFVGSGIMARLTDSLIKVHSSGKRVTVHMWLYDHLLAPFLAPRIASLAYALAFVGLWWIILLILQKRGIYWRA